ncbi:hypothetical protein JHK84_053615 [Glycine max]|nr:hypothetical protein JHK87_053654 [Glycine soja]KAG4928053.1 hypothetical protein JHK85_054539 [Glycine max]KAG5083577.1 hypothetical protein JHK84_053615 [Glycine max]
MHTNVKNSFLTVAKGFYYGAYCDPETINSHVEKAHDSGNDNLSPTSITIPQIESDMQELVQLVLQNSSDGMHSNVTNSFLTVAKGFYYGAYCNPETINSH